MWKSLQLCDYLHARLNGRGCADETKYMMVQERNSCARRRCCAWLNNMSMSREYIELVCGDNGTIKPLNTSKRVQKFVKLDPTTNSRTELTTFTDVDPTGTLFRYAIFSSGLLWLQTDVTSSNIAFHAEGSAQEPALQRYESAQHLIILCTLTCWSLC